MPDAPIVVDRVECSDGTRKVRVREREYDLISWAGLRSAATVLFGTAAVISTVLFSYYTAEGAQNKQLAQHEEAIAAQARRLDDNDKRLREAITQLTDVLREQQKTFEETTKAVVRIGTRQEVLIEQVKELQR
jgi:septal ring factor EnvC (AmiA/AmiB activator)